MSHGHYQNQRAGQTLPQRYSGSFGQPQFATQTGGRHWNTRSHSVGSLSALQSSTQNGQLRMASSTSQRISSLPTRNTRSVSYLETHNAWSASSLPQANGVNTPAQVPERYHRGRVSSTLSLPSLSPSMRSVDVDSSSTQTSESSVSSLPEDELTAKAIMTTSRSVNVLKTPLEIVGSTSTSPVRACTPDQITMRSVSISPLQSPQAPIIKSDTLSIEAKGSTSLETLKPSTSPVSLPRVSQSPEILSLSRPPSRPPSRSRSPGGLVLPSDSRPRSPIDEEDKMLPGLPTTRSLEGVIESTNQRTESRRSSITSEIRRISPGKYQNSAQAGWSQTSPQGGGLQSGQQHQHRRSFSTVSLGNTTPPASSVSITTNQPINPQEWRAGVPQFNVPSHRRSSSSGHARSISQSPQHSAQHRDASVDQSMDRDKPTARVQMPHQPSFQDLRTEPRRSATPVQKIEAEKPNLSSRLKGFFKGSKSNKKSKARDADNVSVMSGKSGMSTMSVMSGRSVASAFSFRSVRDSTKRLFRKDMPIVSEIQPETASYSTAQMGRMGGAGGPQIAKRDASASGSTTTAAKRQSMPTLGRSSYSSATYRNSMATSVFDHRRYSSGLTSMPQRTVKLDETALPDSSTPKLPDLDEQTFMDSNNSYSSTAVPQSSQEVMAEHFLQTPSTSSERLSLPARDGEKDGAQETEVESAHLSTAATHDSQSFPENSDSRTPKVNAPEVSISDLTLSPALSIEEGAEEVDLAQSDTVFPRSLDDQGIATIRNAVERVGSIDRKPSQRSSRRVRSGASEADKSEEKVPNAQEVHATSFEELVGSSFLDFDNKINVDLDLDLSFTQQLMTAFDGPVPAVDFREPGPPGPLSGGSMLPPRPQGRETVQFASQIMVFDTYSCDDYDRRPEPATCNRLTPTLAQQIKHELNSFKLSMDVHRDSRAYTHFF